MPQQVIDLTYQQFGKWFVLQRGSSSRTGRSRWICQCNCGIIKLVQSTHLKRGSSTQCMACAKFQGYEQISLSHWNHIVKSAQQRQYIFTITIQEAWNQFLRQKQKCALTGQHLVFARLYQIDLQTASLDRIDSSTGYIINNIQWIHKDINMLKGPLVEDKFIQLCKLVTTYQDGKLNEQATLKSGSESIARDVR